MVRHGITISEESTALVGASVSEGITVAIGTAVRGKVNEPVVCYTKNEYEAEYGSASDTSYSLNEVAAVAFDLYNVQPVIFINVLDYGKHGVEEVADYEGLRQVRISGLIDTGTVKVTTGERIEPVKLESGIDYEVSADEVDDLDSGEVEVVKTLRLNAGGRVVVSYRLTGSALGGEAIETEVTISAGGLYELPADTLLESVEVRTVGVDTLREVAYVLEEVGSEVEITIPFGATLIDDMIKITYNRIDIGRVTSADVIEGLNAVEGIYARTNLVPGQLIAPGYSTDTRVAAAMAAKARSIAGVFKAMAISDLAAADYQAAIDFKNRSSLNDSHLIVCWPGVELGGVQYHLSTHLAALMNLVDSENGDLPYISPSNKNLKIDNALAQGKAIYLTQEQANLLNGAGIGTAFSFGGWKFWGNLTSLGPDDDFKDKFIPVRRMLNFLQTYFVLTYFSTLDMPINMRSIESILQSANIYLGSLAARGVILGGELTFDEADNPETELLNGALHFRLRVMPPPPAQEINVTMQIDTSYLNNLFS